MKQSIKKKVLCFIFIKIIFLINASISFACLIDEPDCACFVDGGAWNPSGDLLTVANQTLGTVESCGGDNRGKPFWQMIMGYNNPSSITTSVAVANQTRGNNNWCSETIAYWHREANFPYNQGYRNSWNTTWQMATTDTLRVWYQTEEGLSNGRGRWIDATVLDLDDFQPGINAPCPGAYQQLMGYTPSSSDPWAGANNAHSQMIESMVVYHKPNGRIVDFDLQMIEGNASSQVQNTTVFTSAPNVTPQGSQFIGSNRKIRGWGIDLDTEGNSECYTENIEYVLVPYEAEDIHFAPNFSLPEDEEEKLQISKNINFGKAIAEIGIKAKVNGLLNKDLIHLMNAANTRPLIIPARVLKNKRANLVIQYPLPLPYAVDKVELHLAANQAELVQLTYAGVDAAKPSTSSMQQVDIKESVITILLNSPIELQYFNLMIQTKLVKDLQIEAIYLHPAVEQDDGE